MADGLFLNKKRIDLFSKTSITRKIQIGEVSKVSERRSSYSYTIKIPKTANNIYFFDMLSVQGNTSRKPFEGIIADYIVDSIYLVLNGYAIVSESSEYYSLNIIDGVRSLSDLLSKKKLIDLPLSDLNHVLTTENYIKSFANTEGYIYGIADYGRKVSTTVKVEKQAPSIFVHTLMRRIFESNNLSLQGDFFKTNEKYLSEVVTPARGYEVLYGQSTEIPKGSAETNELSKYESSNEYFRLEYKFEITDINLDGFSVVNGEIVVGVAGTYTFDFNIYYNIYETYAGIIINVNSEYIASYGVSGGNQTQETTTSLSLEVGDVISLSMFASPAYDYYDYQGAGASGYIVNYTMSVYISCYLQTGGQVVIPSDYIGDMTQLDFIKDVINRHGLIMHPVQSTDEFRFRRLEVVLNDVKNADDWTNKLSKYQSEKYNSGYAKVSTASFKYPESIVIPNSDGDFEIDNINASEKGTLFASAFEIPDKSTSGIDFEPTYFIPIWGEESEQGVVVETKLNHSEQVDGVVLLTDGSYNGFINDGVVFGDYGTDGVTFVDSATKWTTGFVFVAIPFMQLVRVNGDLSYFVYAYDGALQPVVVDAGNVYWSNNFESATIPPNVFFIKVVFPSANADIFLLKNLANADWVVRKYESIEATTKTYEATGRVDFANNAFVCFYDINDVFISYQYNGTSASGVIDRTKSVLFPPANCKIIRISGDINFLPELHEKENITITTATNLETPLKVMHVNRIDKDINVKFYDEQPGIEVSEDIPFLNLDFISLSYVVGNYYRAFQSLINNYKAVSLSINLSVVDVFNLDFFRLKYLKQTGRYYYLDSVQYTNSKISKVNALEILEFPTNRPPVQSGSYEFDLNIASERVITVSNITTGYEDPEEDLPYSIKFLNGFNSDVVLLQDGIAIVDDTEILIDDLNLSVLEASGDLLPYVKTWQYKISDEGSRSFGDESGVLTANILEFQNLPPVARAGNDIEVSMYPSDFPFTLTVNLNGAESYDLTGEIISWEWAVISSPPFSTATTEDGLGRPYGDLIIPNDNPNNAGVYIVELTVTDNYGLSDTDTVRVEVNAVN